MKGRNNNLYIQALEREIESLRAQLEAQSGEAVAYAKEGVLDDDGWAQVCHMNYGKYCVPLYLAPPAAKVPECTWHCDDESSMWEGSCGAAWYFESGGPVENKQNYCPSCGGKCVLAAREGERHES